MADLKNEFEQALRAAQLNISNFEPPSALKATADASTSIPVTIDIEAVKAELATFSAKELTKALFDTITALAQENARKEIDSQQLVQKISSLQTQVTELQAVLARNGLA